MAQYYTHATANLPRVSLVDLQDWDNAGRDSTGRCRDDNPLKEWGPDEWYPPDELRASHPWLEKLDWDAAAKATMMVALNKDQVVAMGEPVFGQVYTVYLITNDTQNNYVWVHVQAFVASC